MPTDKDVEDENEHDDSQKNSYDSGTDINDEMERSGKVVDDRAVKDGCDIRVYTDMPHADTAQLEEHKTEVGRTSDEGGDDGQGEQRDGDDDGKGNGLGQDILEGCGPEENVSEGDEHEVVENIIEGGHENDGQNMKTGDDGNAKWSMPLKRYQKRIRTKSQRRSMPNLISTTRNT